MQVWPDKETDVIDVTIKVCHCEGWSVSTRTDLIYLGSNSI